MGFLLKMEFHWLVKVQKPHTASARSTSVTSTANISVQLQEKIANQQILTFNNTAALQPARGRFIPYGSGTDFHLHGRAPASRLDIEEKFLGNTGFFTFDILPTMASRRTKAFKAAKSGTAKRLIQLMSLRIQPSGEHPMPWFSRSAAH